MSGIPPTLHPPFNPNAPFGFRHIRQNDGFAPNYGLRTGMLAMANTDKIFRGDVLAPTANGYFTLAVPGTAPIGGVVESFEWQSFSQQMTVRRNWWPGNGDALTDIVIYMYSTPQAVFEVQAAQGPIGQADVGKYADWVPGPGGIQIGAGNQSSAMIDDTTLTDTPGTLPFRIYGLPIYTPLIPLYQQSGYNATQPFNRVWVQMADLSLPG